MNANITNRASKILVDISKSSEVYQKRINSKKTACAVVETLGALPFAKSSTFDGSYGNGYMGSSSSSRRQIKKKRPLDEHETINFSLSLKPILEKAKQKGFLQVLEVFHQTFGFIKEIKLIEDPNELSRKHAEDAELFLRKMNNVPHIKEAYGICCTVRRAIKPRAVSCKSFGCAFLIDIGVTCWQASGTNETNDKIIICNGCQTGKSSSNIVTVRVKRFSDQEHLNNEWIFIDKPKTDFKRTNLSANEEMERTVKCVFCLSAQHTQCVMYDHFNWTKAFEKHCEGFSDNFRTIYVCQRCMHMLQEDKSPEKYPVVQFHPKDIKPSIISTCIEKSVREFLRSRCMYNSEDKIYVREVSSRKTTFEAKTNMKCEFKKHGRPFSWDVRQRSIMVFQERRDLNYPIALFNLIVHEYPAISTISLSYIDSVKLFEPASLRRPTFQEVILAYMENARSRGYLNMHFWVCPPQLGDEYVFYGRPEEETRPSFVQGGDRGGIIGWYKELLTKADSRGAIKEYCQTNSTQPPYKSHLDIPYLSEDFWPPKLEVILEAYNKETQEYTSAQSARSSKRQRVSVKGKRSSISGGPPASLASRIEEIIRVECKDALFSVKFNPFENGKVIEEDEVDILCSYMSNRDNFIVDCRESKYDFSTARCAQYSTLVMCSRMAKESFTTKCSQCESFITSGIYCYQSPEDSIVCYRCSGSVKKHEHELVRRFQVPFVDKKVRPHPVFATILKHLHEEGEFLSGVSACLSSPNTNNLRFHSHMYQAEVVKEHEALLNHCDHEKTQTVCRACAAAWLPLLRHKEFCKGNVCNVPSCTSNVVLNNQGIALKPGGSGLLTLRNPSQAQNSL